MKILFSTLIFALVALGQTRPAAPPTLLAASSPVVPGTGTAAGGYRFDKDAPMQGTSELTVAVNKSVVLDHAAGIRRVSITNPDIAEAVAVSSVELLINGKSAGDTTLILWDPSGTRRSFDIHVIANDTKTELVRAELLKEVGPAVSLNIEDGNVFLRGTVPDAVQADRAASIAATLGKVVNLLRLPVPSEAPQILLKVRFADIDRTATSQLGFNFFSGNQKGIANTTTSQFGQAPTGLLGGAGGQGMTLTDLLNIFYFRPDLNIGAVIQALEAKQLLQMLAEPNLLTLSGKPASFLAGGEFPFPTLQGGAAGVGQITIQFKEFGIKLNFLPTITPRGTIHLEVMPEVSSLDYSNGLTVSGFTIPGLATRRVKTEIELQNGQSFVIAGLLNNQVTDQFNKVPGIGNIPVLGKLFQSRSLSKTNSELLVLVTPELVRPIPTSAKKPDLDMPAPFLKGAPLTPPQTPGAAITGPAQPLSKFETVPVEAPNWGQPTAAPPSNAPAPLMLVQPVQVPQSNSQSPQQQPGSSNH